MKPIKIKPVFAGSPFSRFNVAAWPNKANNNIILVGRQIESAARSGQPDKGKLFLVEIDQDNQIVHERIIWEPRFESLTLEDPRAMIIEGDQVVIGLTAVLRKRRGYEPFPALAKLNTQSWKDELPPITLIQTFGPGKNITPLKNDLYLFRPEDHRHNHSLIIFSLHDLVPQKLQDLDFPTDLPWADWRIGTTMAPIWFDANNALMIIHGITKKNNKYIYSLGRAKLTCVDNGYKVQVAPEPILTPDSFRAFDKKIKTRELHPRIRRVIYACGGIVNPAQPSLELYVNVGDTSTFQVVFSLSDLTSELF